MTAVVASRGLSGPRAVAAALFLVAAVVLTSCAGAGSDAGAGTGEVTGSQAPATLAPETPSTVQPTGNGSDRAPATTAPPVTSTTAAIVPSAGDLAGLVVVVDPGHNGANGSHGEEIGRLVDAGGFRKACNTTGAAEGSVTESRVNWETAQRVRDLLEARGATVVMTRTSDDGWGPCVDQRGLAAQRAGADLLLSIHADGAAPGASGFHVIHPSTGPTVTATTADASRRLATEVRDALAAKGLVPASYVGGDGGIVARTDIATVNRAGVPAVMVECGNLHNPEDLAVLRSPSGQQRIAEGLVAAVASFAP